MLKGIIIKGIGGFYYVKAADGKVYECKARGIFRKEKITPMVGDRVTIEVNNQKGSITEIDKRTCVMIRPPVANIDMLLLVVACTSPEPNLFLIDKLLTYAQKLEIEVVICLNKTDLCNCEDLKTIYSDAGYKVICVSAETNENIQNLKEVLKNRVTALAGLSGVGKSSLLNLITENQMETGDLSAKISRGKHTTRHVELIELEEGGYVFDTPGFSSFEILDFKATELSSLFREFSDIEDMCRFKGCAHINEPDCEVRRRVENGTIAQSRYESYKQMYNIVKSKKEW